MLVTMIRTVILYFFVVFAIRALGKRQAGELEPVELAIMIMIADLASIPMQNPDLPLLVGIIPIVVLTSIGALLSLLTMRSPFARKVFFGKPSIIIENGRLNQAEIRRLRLNLDEIAEELRLKDITDITSVRYGILETNGHFSIILYPKFQPVTCIDLNIEPKAPEELNISLISNGKLLKENLPLAGLTKAELEETLRKRNINAVKDVFYMVRQSDGGLFIVRREK